MKNTILSLLMILWVCACSHLRPSNAAAAPVQGSWAGEGRFLDRDLAAEHGTFPLALQIHADGSVTGTVGSSSLEAGVIEARRDDYLVTAQLTEPLGGQERLEHKDCVVLILQPVETSLEGNIHLKTNFTLDLGMRVGALSLSRAP